MIAKSLWLAPLVCVLLAQPANDDKAKKDLDKMQGTWTMQALEVDGKDLPADKLGDTQLIVKADDYHTRVKGKDLAGFRIKLDPSKDPKEIDMIKKEADGTETVFKGIYVFENGVFKMCRGLNADQRRPNQFATWPDTGYFVVTWKKK
jgi:uncharacterized protein (TIGR03067 family)